MLVFATSGVLGLARYPTSGPHLTSCLAIGCIADVPLELLCKCAQLLVSWAWLQDINLVGHISWTA